MTTSMPADALADQHAAMTAEPLGIAGLEARALERATIQRIAWRIIPILVLCYFVAYLDRVNLSFAALQMDAALHLSSEAYGLGAGLFFLTYCVCEIPSNLLLYRFGATRWIARIMFTLGLCAGGMALVSGQTSFYIVRLLLGAAEAGFYPGVLFLLTLWFPAAYRARMLGVFIAAIPVSGIIGAPLSGLLLSFNGHGGLQGWQWLYLVEAAPALALAPIVAWRLQDGPAQARWMPERERAWLIAEMDRERAAMAWKPPPSAVQSLTDKRVLFLAAIYFSNVCLLNSITFFLPQIVKGFGLSNAQTGLVAAIPSLLALFAMLWWAQRSDRKQERYGHAAVANLVGGAALLLSVLMPEPAVRVASLAVAFACTLAFTTPFWSIPGTFLTGGGAAGGIGTISALGVVGGFLAPWFIGVMKDHTGDFRIGLGAIGVLAMMFAAALFAAGRAPPAVPARMFLDQAADRQRLPVILLSGFLGSGKTTVVNALLRDPRLADTAVAINEFGEVPLDQLLVQHDRDATVVMANGCLCCNLAGDIEDAVMRIFDRRESGALPRFRRLIVEPSGLADPAPIAQAILGNPVMSRALRLAGIIATVDAMFAEAQLARHAESRKQVALADTLVLTKCDVAEPGATARVEQRVRGLNPSARLLRATQGVVEAGDLLPASFYDPAVPDAVPACRDMAAAGHRHGTHAVSVSLVASGPLRWRGFDAWLREVRLSHGERLLRVKGIIDVAEAGGPVVVQGVHHVLHAPVALERWPDEDRRTRLVLILLDADLDSIREGWSRFVENCPTRATQLATGGPLSEELGGAARPTQPSCSFV